MASPARTTPPARCGGCGPRWPAGGLAVVIGAARGDRHRLRPGVDGGHAHRPAQAVIDRRAVALAGHTGDVATAEAGLAAADRRRAGDRARRPRAPRRASTTTACGPRSTTPTPRVRRRAVDDRRPPPRRRPAGSARRRRSGGGRGRRHGPAASTSGSATTSSPALVGLAGERCRSARARGGGRGPRRDRRRPRARRHPRRHRRSPGDPPPRRAGAGSVRGARPRAGRRRRRRAGARRRRP